MLGLTTVARAANSSDAESSRPPADRPGVRIWLPLDGARPETPPARLHSSATYRVEANRCPPGTWRWVAHSETRLVEADIASALIVRLELPDAAPDVAAALADAAEKIASACRVTTGAGLEEEEATTVRFPPSALPVASMQAAWSAEDAQRLDLVTQVISEHVASENLPNIRLTAIVARERVRAECGLVELCEESGWRIDGFRARSTQRQPLPPLFFSASHAGMDTAISDPASEPPAAHQLAVQLIEWLKANYLHEAAAAALLVDGGDPCLLAGAPGTGPR